MKETKIIIGLILFLICIIIITIIYLIKHNKKQTKDNYSTDSSQITFNMLQYNIQLDLKIYIHEGDMHRAKMIPIEATKINNGDIDVFGFCEAFQEEPRFTLYDGFRNLGWKYHTGVLNAGSLPTNGGVTIVSRWPIVKSDQHTYSNCTGSDCLAKKANNCCQFTYKTNSFYKLLWFKDIQVIIIIPI